MQFITNGENVKDLHGFFCCDNDFLGILSTDEDFLIEILYLFKDKLMLDPFTKIEFLREVYLPKQRLLKEQIIAKAFIIAESPNELVIKIMDDTLEISRIYAHQKRSGAGVVDLLLASRLKNIGYKAYLVTGNAKHFPSIIFNTKAVINYEQNDGTMRAISVIEFDRKKYQEAEEKYARIEIKI